VRSLVLHSGGEPTKPNAFVSNVRAHYGPTHGRCVCVHKERERKSEGARERSEGAREQERGSKRERMCQCVKESADYLLMYTCIDTSRVQISICPGRSAQAYCRTLDFKCVVDMCLCIFFFQMHSDSVLVCVLLFVRMWANGRHQKEVGKGRRNRPPR